MKAKTYIAIFITICIIGCSAHHNAVIDDSYFDKDLASNGTLNGIMNYTADGTLHYFIVDTIFINNPYVVSLDDTSTFIMSDSVYENTVPSYENYINNDQVYLFAELDGAYIQMLYYSDEVVPNRYKSRVIYSKPDITLWDNNYVVPNVVVKQDGPFQVVKWEKSPSKFILMLIRGKSYITYTYYMHHVDYNRTPLYKPLPLKNPNAYYKIVYPIFE